MTISNGLNHGRSDCMRITSKTSSVRLCHVRLITLLALAITCVGSLLAVGEERAVPIAGKEYVAANSGLSGLLVGVATNEKDYAPVQVIPKDPSETDAS